MFIVNGCFIVSALSIWLFIMVFCIFIILCSYNRIIQFQQSNEFLVIYLPKLNICEVTFSVSNYFIQSNLLNSIIK